MICDCGDAITLHLDGGVCRADGCDCPWFVEPPAVTLDAFDCASCAEPIGRMCAVREADGWMHADCSLFAEAA